MKANRITLDRIKSCNCQYVELRSGKKIKVNACKFHKTSVDKIERPQFPEPPPTRRITKQENNYIKISFIVAIILLYILHVITTKSFSV